MSDPAPTPEERAPTPHPVPDAPPGPRELPPEVVQQINAHLEIMMQCAVTVDQGNFQKGIFHLRELMKIPGQEKPPELWHLPTNVQQVVVALYLGMLNNACAMAGVFEAARVNLKHAQGSGGLLGPDGMPL